jgi:hypothetical protein
MQDMVYERNVDTKYEILQQIFNAARHVNDAALLHKASAMKPAASPR